MAGINDIIDEYLGVAISPEEMRDLALMQVNDASVQDDAVQKAVANAQGVEARNRSALEEYLRMADEQAAAESQRALEMAQQRLNAIDNNMALISTTVGVGKEGKQKLKSLEAERQAILEAFPQLGKAPEGSVSMVDDNTFDIAKMLSEKDYSPETIAKLFEANDWDVWDQALRTGDLDLYQAMLDSKLGALPEGMAEKMRYTVAGMPETSKALKLNDKYSRLRGILGETQGDLKKKDRDEKAAADKAALNSEISKATEHAKALISSDGEVWDTLSQKEKANLKKHLNDLPAEIRDEVASAVKALMG
ncbi:MAG: hypothetical protein J6P30_01785 [Fibrobacter sp.]|nr:hypothetical protein [Fibrobacter sp.]